MHTNPHAKLLTVLITDPHMAPGIVVHTLDDTHSPFVHTRLLKAHHRTFLGTRSKAFSRSTKAKQSCLYFCNVLLLQLANNEDGISCAYTRHKGELNPVNTLRTKQNGRRFADDTFKRIFLNENVRISIMISLKFVPKGPINNNPALVQIMAWRRSGDKPLSEPMMLSLLTHICVTRPQWVNIHHLVDRGI